MLQGKHLYSGILECTQEVCLNNIYFESTKACLNNTIVYNQITGFENKQYCLYESFPVWYKQCEWHAKFIVGAIFQKYNSIINNGISSFW